MGWCNPWKGDLPGWLPHRSDGLGTGTKAYLGSRLALCRTWVKATWLPSFISIGGNQFWLSHSCGARFGNDNAFSNAFHCPIATVSVGYVRRWKSDIPLSEGFCLWNFVPVTGDISIITPLKHNQNMHCPYYSSLTLPSTGICVEATNLFAVW